jgi:hypothetical protein
MTRRTFIERELRQLYGAFPSDDSQITDNLLNAWLTDALAFAAKQNYVDSYKLDGIAYVNNSFYTTFSELTISEDDIFTYSISLPQIPVGIGTNEGLASLILQSTTGTGGTGKSFNCIPLSINQVGINDNRRTIPNRYEYWYEGGKAYIKTMGQMLNIGFTATVRMISGGDDTDLDSVLNAPPDYFGAIVEYIKAQLSFMLGRVQDSSNDGVDNNNKN